LSVHWLRDSAVGFSINYGSGCHLDVDGVVDDDAVDKGPLCLSLFLPLSLSDLSLCRSLSGMFVLAGMISTQRSPSPSRSLQAERRSCCRRGSTKGPMWGYPDFVLGAVCSFLEPFCGHLSPNIDNVSEKLTLRYHHEGPLVGCRPRCQSLGCSAGSRVVPT